LAHPYIEFGFCCTGFAGCGDTEDRRYLTEPLLAGRGRRLGRSNKLIPSFYNK
jgi:hypothetical protein